MNRRYHILGVVSVFAIIFIVFVNIFEDYSEHRFREILGDHARVIGDDLWARDKIGPIEYVTLAARLGKYRKLRVYEFEQDVFLELDGPKPSVLDQFFLDLGLITVEIGQANILHSGDIIGRLVVERYRDTVYVYAYSLFLLISLLVAYLFFIRTLQAKQELENRVEERTAELRQLRNYLSNIINSMPSILIGIDRNGRVTQWNNEAQRVTGLSPEVAMGQAFEEAFPRLTEDVELVREAIQMQRVNTLHRRTRIENNETRYEDIAVFPLLADGFKGAVIRLDDVTDRVRMEEMMIQSEKMLSVGGLAAGMAHEINNPLGGMMQTAKALSNRIGSDRPLTANDKAAREAGTTMEVITQFMRSREIPQMLSGIIESGERLANIVNNMLDFSRKGDSGRSQHYLTELLEQTLELAATDFDLKKHYDFRAIEISKQYDQGLKPVSCESSKIQQVLFNILKNGAQAMREAQIDQPRFVLKTWLNNQRNMACVAIEDNGPGMDQEVQKRIFEPFFTTKAVDIGTGLGLSISYFIVTEHHEGEMEVESRPGGGTRFVIRLPCDEMQACA